MNIVATTRFDTKTWTENKSWREKREYKGCIYGCPVRIKDDVFPNILIFILEMHNDSNKIMGIGLIRNKILTKNKARIYSDENYNRYIYLGDYRIDRQDLTMEEKKIVIILEELVFYGKGHLKRGQGIQILPSWILNNPQLVLSRRLGAMFQARTVALRC